MDNIEDESTSLNIIDLPDIFLLSVFKHLNLKQRLQYASVCKKWNVLLRDGSLWTKLDLKPYKNEINLYGLKKLISLNGCVSMKELTLFGNYNDNIDKIKKTNETNDQQVREQTDAYLDKLFYYIDGQFVNKILAEKSPNLTHIYLECLDLSLIKFEHFIQFSNLELLSIKWCQLSAGSSWFNLDDENIQEEKQMLNLKHIYLIRSGDELSTANIDTLCRTVPHLKTLSINQSKSTLRDDAVELIAKQLTQLENLELNNTLITDDAIYLICNSTHLASKLITLNLTRSSSLSNNCLQAISASLLKLKSLHLTSCFGISNVKLLTNLINLNYLNINNTSIDKQKIKEILVPALSKCEIEFGHEKMLNRKLMWTINGSRNCVCSF